MGERSSIVRHALVDDDAAGKNENNIFSGLNGDAVCICGITSILGNVGDQAMASLKCKGMSSPIACDGNRSRIGLYREFWVEECKLLGDGSNFYTATPNSELWHSQFELFLNICDLDTSPQISKTKISRHRIGLCISIEDVIIPLVLDIHVGPTPSLFDSPSRWHCKDCSSSV